jgi:hypothetical protein
VAAGLQLAQTLTLTLMMTTMTTMMGRRRGVCK